MAMTTGSSGLVVETVVQSRSLHGQDARPTAILNCLIPMIPEEPDDWQNLLEDDYPRL